MPVPYRRPAPTTVQSSIGYVKVIRTDGAKALLGALLLLDSRGRPLEFVYNRLETPGGFLWPQEQVNAAGITALCHSLFDATTRAPELLLAESDLGSRAFCADLLAPTVPFGLLGGPSDDGSVDWVWVNSAPTAGMTAYGLVEELRVRAGLLEPFARAVQGLREVYPGEPWPDRADDPTQA